MHRFLRVALVLTCFCIFLNAREHHHKRILHARDFADNPFLEAEGPRVIWLDSQLASGPKEPVIRYKLERGEHLFCLKGNDPYYTGLSLRDGQGRVIFNISSAEHCRAIYLEHGHYIIHVHHSRSVPDPGKPSSVGVDAPESVPIHDANGNPLGGYWAISANGHAVHPLPPPKNLGDIYTNDMPVVVDNTQTSWDETSLFSFPPQQHPLALAPSGFFLDLFNPPAEQSGNEFLISGNHECELNIFNCDALGVGPPTDSRGLTINDLGYWQFTLTHPRFGNTTYFAISPSAVAPNSIRALPNVTPQKFALQFRYYPDGSTIGTLTEGEIAIFEQCNFQGPAVVATNLFEPSSLRIGGNTPQFLSVRLSNNTAVSLTTQGPNPFDPPGEPFWIYTDTACLAKPLMIATNTLPLDQLIGGMGNTNFSCPNCKLENAEFGNVNIQNADWRGADMTKATLVNAKFTAGTKLNGAKFVQAELIATSFTGAILDGANFTGATLSCVDFSGTSNNLRDLTGLSLTNVIWVQNPGCLSNLSYTKLTTAILPPSYWKYADLTGAVFTDLTPGMHLSTQTNPLDLTGAKLAHINFNQASLDYAVLNSADLTGANLRNSSLRHISLESALMYGVNLDNANLDGADMYNAYLDALPNGNGATLIGAFLRNVNLSKSHLNGASFTNASFFGSTAPASCLSGQGFTNNCASASGATLNGAIFAGAFLYGVDFSGATIQGIQFANAVVIGASFANATLTGDPRYQAGSGFPGAFLQGTNLGSTKQLLDISLLNAYVDFSGANAFTMKLSGNHTVFPGYANPGEPVCVQLSYSNGTAAPTNNATLMCPHGSLPSTGCGAQIASNTAWKSQVDISASGTYQFDATYTKASPQQFCTPDQSWLFGGVGDSRPPRKRHKRK